MVAFRTGTDFLTAILLRPAIRYRYNIEINPVKTGEIFFTGEPLQPRALLGKDRPLSSLCLWTEPKRGKKPE
ncbi:MAG: hypothetical protein CVU57_07450 [Deltaproteobacteria bacterium HGW-Deltaproteobacteria-15]|nr:MAG: hypothetical protein CVU57_07450 [Deltaproteobacteria bacterium HGW-Deltaproteobacteria-15]